MKPQDDELKNLLHEWRDLPSCDCDLHRKVFAVCSDRGAGFAAESAWWAWWTNLGFGLHPARAAVWCILAGGLIGAAVGEYQASRQRQDLRAEMPSRYLTQIDPTRTYAALDSR